VGVNEGEPGQIHVTQRFAEAVATAFAALGAYMIIGDRVRASNPPVVTWVDDAVPFWPQSVWFYLPVYAAAFFLAVGVVNGRRAWRATVAAFFGAAIVANAIFVVWPIAGPRPAAPADDSLSSAMVRWIYGFDPNFNTFPSLHIALVTLAALVVSSVNPRVAWLSWAAAFSVWTSVLTLKQHWAIDLPGGWVLALVAWAGWRRFALPTQYAADLRAGDKSTT
jgi:hypothetical protein